MQALQAGRQLTLLIVTLMSVSSGLLIEAVHGDESQIADAQLRARLNSFSRGQTSPRAPATAITSPAASIHRSPHLYAAGDVSPIARPDERSTAPVIPKAFSAEPDASADQPVRMLQPVSDQPTGVDQDAEAHKATGSGRLQPVSHKDQLRPGSGPIDLTSASDATADPTSAAVTQVPFLDLDAADDAVATSSTAATGDTELIVRFIVGTVVVLGLCVLVIFGIRRWQQKHGLLPPTSGPSRVLETVVIGNRQTISLVQLQGLQAVVGCDATGIKSIVLAPPSFEDNLPPVDAHDSSAASTEPRTATLSANSFIPDP